MPPPVPAAIVAPGGVPPLLARLIERATAADPAARPADADELRGALASILRASPGITRWGQLGLSGEWADRAIRVYTPPLEVNVFGPVLPEVEARFALPMDRELPLPLELELRDADDE